MAAPSQFYSVCSWRCSQAAKKASRFGVRLEEFVKSGVIGIVSLFLGLFVSFFAGGAVAFAFTKTAKH
jgi:hypothetical protein